MDMSEEITSWECARYHSASGIRTRGDYLNIKVLVPYNNIMICFGEDKWGKMGVRCLDAVDKEWYIQSDKKVYDMNIDKSYFIGTGGRYCYYYKDDGRPKHERIDLFDACPKELQKKIQDEMKLNMIIPDYLKRIVFRYFNDLPK